MSNNKPKAVKDDIVQFNGPAVFDVTPGRLYIVTGHTEPLRDGLVGAKFQDDKGNNRVLWTNSEYEVVGKAIEELVLTDVHGQTVKAGDYIAYASVVDNRVFQRVLEVLVIGAGKVAHCRNVVDSAPTYLGAFDQRALKLKDYAA